jgi:hypothetical protein
VGDQDDDHFAGRGFTPEMLETAERISAEIPAPFLRIDFHSTGSELVFCEFTPTSGSIWSYGRETDQFLGECYLDAEARLLDDLLKGKSFDVYNSFYKSFQREHEPVSDRKPAVLLESPRVDYRQGRSMPAYVQGNGSWFQTFPFIIGCLKRRAELVSTALTNRRY